MNIKHLTTAAAALAILGGAARADQGALQLYDAQGHLVGQLGEFDAFITLNGNLYELEVQRDSGTRYLSTFPTANFWYTSTTCTGQRYLLDYGEVTPKVYYEAAASPGSRGHQLWTYGNSVSTINANSYWYAYGGYCIPFAWSFGNGTPAVDLGDMRFYPPYYVSRNGSHGGD